MAVRKPIVLISGVMTQLPGVDTLNVGLGIISDGSNPLTLDAGAGAVQIAANRDFSAVSGSGNFDWSNASGTFKTSQGVVTIGPGAVGVSGATTFSAAGVAVTVNNDLKVLGEVSVDGNLGRSTNGTLLLGTDAQTTAITIGSSGVTTTVAGPLAINGGVSANSIVTGLTTTGIASGDMVYVSAANTVAKTDSASVTTSRFFGVGEGVSGSITRAGVLAAAKFTTAGGQPTNGGIVWLAAATDDSSTGAGKLTATPPSTGVSAEIGVVLDNSNYASAKTCKVLLQPKAIVVL